MSRSKKKKTVASSGGGAKGAQGRRFTLKEKKRALTLIASGMEQAQVAAAVGTRKESLRR